WHDRLDARQDHTLRADLHGRFFLRAGRDGFHLQRSDRRERAAAAYPFVHVFARRSWARAFDLDSCQDPGSGRADDVRGHAALDSTLWVCLRARPHAHSFAVAGLRDTTNLLFGNPPRHRAARCWAVGSVAIGARALRAWRCLVDGFERAILAQPRVSVLAV